MHYVLRSFSAFLLVLSFGAQVSAQPDTVPEAVSSHYDDHNFAYALSTDAERASLAQYSSSEEVTRETGSERLGRVYSALRRIRAELLAVDPTMVIRPGTTRTETEQAPARLLEIIEVHRASADRILVKAEGYLLGPQVTLELIRSYEEGAGDPSLNEQIVRRGLFSRPEVHTWVRKQDKWYRKRPYMQYLSQ